MFYNATEALLGKGLLTALVLPIRLLDESVTF